LFVFYLFKYFFILIGIWNL